MFQIKVVEKLKKHVI